MGSLDFFLQVVRLEDIYQEHGDRHGADTARDGGNGASDFFDRVEVDIALETFICSCCADIDDGRARFYHGVRYESWDSFGDDQNVCLLNVLCEVCAFCLKGG